MIACAAAAKRQRLRPSDAGCGRTGGGSGGASAPTRGTRRSGARWQRRAGSGSACSNAKRCRRVRRSRSGSKESSVSSRGAPATRSAGRPHRETLRGRERDERAGRCPSSWASVTARAPSRRTIDRCSTRRASARDGVVETAPPTETGIVRGIARRGLRAAPRAAATGPRRADQRLPVAPGDIARQDSGEPR